jgi:hypothetical protein
MNRIKAFKVRGEGYGNLAQLSVKRDWMEDTWEAHAYKCFPVSLTNQLGWGISFPEDITFIWDGISDSSPEHVKILQGEKYAYSGRANGTISFNTGIRFVTEPNISLLQMPVPNYLRDGVQPFTTLISTSFFQGELPVAWRITRPNVEITVKANTPIISILPIDLNELQNSEVVFEDLSSMPQVMEDQSEYGNIVYEINKSGKWTNFYRDAVDHKGNKLGEHQVKAIRLSVKE